MGHTCFCYLHFKNFNKNEIKFEDKKLIFKTEKEFYVFDYKFVKDGFMIEVKNFYENDVKELFEEFKNLEEIYEYCFHYEFFNYYKNGKKIIHKKEENYYDIPQEQVRWWFRFLKEWCDFSNKLCRVKVCEGIYYDDRKQCPDKNCHRVSGQHHDEFKH